MPKKRWDEPRACGMCREDLNRESKKFWAAGELIQNWREDHDPEEAVNWLYERLEAIHERSA